MTVSQRTLEAVQQIGRSGTPPALVEGVTWLGTQRESEVGDPLLIISPNLGTQLLEPILNDNELLVERAAVRLAQHHKPLSIG